MSQDAINQLRSWITEQGLDAVMVTQPQNRSYLSGWLNDDVEGAGLLLVGQQQQVLLTNTLYREVAENEAKGQTNLAPDQFEIVYQGSLNEITNPATIIVIREKEAWQTLDGGWVRDYSFADGHSEIHKAADGNFQPWEAEHTIAPPVPSPPDQ